MTLHKQYSTGPNNAHNAYDQNPPTIRFVLYQSLATIEQKILVTQWQSDTIACQWRPAAWCMVKTSSSITKWLSWDKQPGGHWLKKFLTHRQLLIREILLFFTALSVQKVCLTSNVRAGVFSN